MGESEPKSDLRRVIRQSRAARASSHSEETAKIFTEHLTAVAVDSSWSRIASFLPTSTEPPITDFLSEFISQGGWCAVPESGQDGILLWHALGDDFENHLATDSLGMPIPSTQSLTALDSLDAVLVPAAAVDREGNRLGWGKGYYDRFLGFDSDVVDEIPTEPHDKTVDLIVTEEDVYRVRG